MRKYWGVGVRRLLCGWLVGCLSVALLSGVAVAKTKGEQLRLALLLGNNDAGGRATTLQYAEADATKMRDLLVQMSGFSRANTFLLLGKSATEIAHICDDPKEDRRT